MTENHQYDSTPDAGRWAALTWGDLEQWAGSRSVTRGQNYQRQGRVRDLVMSPAGRLLATVTGNAEYVTSVWIASKQDVGQQAEGQQLRSYCSCPIGYDRCKHAVAVVTAYLQCLADDIEVAEVDVDDARWAVLESKSEQSPDERPSDDRIRLHIESKTRDELVALVESLIQRFPELYEEFTEHLMLKAGHVDAITRQARQELATLTAEPGWHNPWADEGWIPDYSRLKHRLERLAELGHHGAVMELGSELLDQGMAQVEQSDDDGETAMALQDCLPVVFDAVARADLPAVDKLLFAIDAHLKDDFDLVGEAAASLLEAQHRSGDWSQVADTLMHRLESMSENTADDFHARFLRDQTTDWLAQALAAAGRADEILSVYEREARLTQSYRRLVRCLIDRGRYDEAAQWAQTGTERTRDRWQGIAAGLADMMRELAELQGRQDIVASHVAQRFFERPSLRTFEELDAAICELDDPAIQQQVRQTALHFLETGEPPVRIAASKQHERQPVVDSDWPLPVPDDLVAAASIVDPKQHKPHYDVLLEMALADGRADDILYWYERLPAAYATTAMSRRYPGAAYADRVAEAMDSTYPEQALAIYQQGLDDNLPIAASSAYEACASYLQKMKPIMQSLGRGDRWHQRVADIREQYRRRPRFMEALDRLEGATIVQTRRNRGQRR